MIITNIELSHDDNLNCISGYCDDFHLWYKFPAIISPQRRADAFLAASLLPSMKLGTDIVIDDDIPVCPVLIDNLYLLQDIFYCWQDYFHISLSKIKISGGLKNKADNGNGNTISFFSGGIDGTYTFKKHYDNIDYLLFAKGIDMQLTSNNLYSEAYENNKNYLNKKNKNIYPMETNVRFLGHEMGVGWSSAAVGGGLSSIALAANVKHCYIASTNTYKNLWPEGSHSLTDRLWSNGYTNIIHDGAEAGRVEKLKYISSDHEILQILRVCWHDKLYNCGECEKCLRTMVNIRALNLDVPTFPILSDQLINSKLSKLKIYHDTHCEYLDENINQARLNNDVILVNTLMKIKRNYRIRKFLNELDDLFLNGFLSRSKKFLLGLKKS